MPCGLLLSEYYLLWPWCQSQQVQKRIGFAKSTPDEVVENNGTFYDVISSEFGGTDFAESPFNYTYGDSSSYTYGFAINQVYADYTSLLTDYVGDSRVYDPATLLFQSWAGGLVAYCPITTTYVNSEVYCDGKLCLVIALQASPLPQTSSALPYLGFKDVFQNFT
jgi:hypothetical protein